MPYESLIDRRSDGDVNIGINNPEITPSGKITRPAISDEQQAWSIISNLEQENKERNLKNARIMAKYNSERPYDPKVLKREGLDWKANFSTKPLASLIDRIVPRFTSAVKAVKYLTAAKLPDTIEGAAKKTDFFRKTITETVRARAGWEDLVSDVATENSLFGFTAVAWLDEYTWFPRAYRQDMFFVPMRTKQSSDFSQIVVLKDEFLIHELFEKVEDQKSATDAGWDVPRTLEAINKAMPQELRSGSADPERVYQDLIRGCSLGASYTGAKVISLYSLLATEADGRVTHWILNGSTDGNAQSSSYNEERTLFKRENRFASMSDALRFFCFQKANGELHGSKGIGREVYAMASVLDRARNEVVDRLQLSGKLLFTAEEKHINRFKMSVVGNAILVSQDFKPNVEKIPGAVEEFFALDNFLTRLLDQIAGSTTPQFDDKDRTTKAEVNAVLMRDAERADAVIERFLTQFANMMTTIQKRLCDPDTIEDDAKEMQEKLLERLTREEIDILANQPAVSVVADFSDRERQNTVVLATEARGNPLYNAREMEHRKLTAVMGADFADAVLLTDNDPTEEAEQSRLQQLELLALTEGQPVPVSPRDNHIVHLNLLQGPIQAAAGAAVENAGAVALLESLVMHGQEHVAQAEAWGVDGKVLGPHINMLKSAIAAIEQLKAQAEQLAAQGLDPDGNPLPPESVPPGAAPAGGVPPQAMV
jgi:hypothetical protein